MERIDSYKRVSFVVIKSLHIEPQGQLAVGFEFLFRWPPEASEWYLP